MTRTVIVGAGSAGMTLAWRLSKDPTAEVVLIEAGVDPGPVVPDSLRREVALPSDYYWPYTDADSDEFLPRGKVLGGSSAANFSGATRGPSASYDSWGLESWNWDSCLPAFRAIEADQQYGDAPYHGSNGPTPVVRRPVSEVDTPLLDAYEKLGHAYIEDHNAPSGVGVGPFPSNRIGPDRASTLLTMLPELRTRSNVTLRASHEVTRVLFSDLRACGVEVAKQESRQIIEADSVVLSAGVYGSPEILFKSGVGPADALRDAGLTVVSEVDELGRGLTEHPLLLLNVESRLPQLNALPALLTLALEGGANRMAHVFPFAGLVPGLPSTAITLVCGLLSPTSRGFLEFGGPRARVHMRHFNSTEDREQAGQILSHARSVLEQLAGTGHILLPEDPWWLGRAADLDRAPVVGYNHPVGTCRMGDDSSSVVDQSLAVRGVENLMVADASVIPEIPRSQTNLAAMMIGYRAAEFLPGH